MKKGKSGQVKGQQSTKQPPQAPASTAELDVSRESSATGRGWALSGLLKRTKSEGARMRKSPSIDVKDKSLTGNAGNRIHANSLWQ